MSQTDPDAPIDNSASQFVILCAINPADKKPYPLKVNPSSGLVVNTEMGPVTLGAVVIKDRVDDLKVDVAKKEFEGTGPDIYGMHTYPLFSNPADPTNAQALPLPYVDGEITNRQLCRPDQQSGIPNRGLAVGLGAVWHEKLVAMRLSVSLDAGNIATFDYLPIYKTRRIKGFLDHSFTDDNIGTLIIETKNVFFTNGTIVTLIDMELITLDSTNQFMEIDYETIGSWGLVAVRNDSAVSKTYRLNLEGVN